MRHVPGRFRLLIGAAALLGGCGGDGGSERGRLLAFGLERQDEVRRNEALAIFFSDALDPASVDAESVHVFRGTPEDPTPFPGRCEVRRHRLLFHPTLNAGDPNPGGLPLNPFGFQGRATYWVMLPGMDRDPPPARVVRSATGQPLHRTFRASFRTAADWLPEDPPIPPRIVRRADANGNPDDDSFRFDPRGPDPFDGRRDLGTDVRISITFSEPMDPTSVRPEPEDPPWEPGGSFRLQEAALGLGIAGSITWTPDARTFTFVPATPLAHRSIPRRYRISLTDQARDLAGNPLLLADDRGIPLRPEEAGFHCRLVPGEDGPLSQRILTFTQPDEHRDPAGTDADIAWGGPPPEDRLGPLPLRARSQTVEEICQPSPGSPPINCPFYLPQPLNVCSGADPASCDPCSGGGSWQSPPGSGNGGGGRIQLLYLRMELRSTRSPAAGDRFPDSEAITGIDWSPQDGLLFRSRYAGITVRLGHSRADEINNGLSYDFETNYDAGSGPEIVFQGDYSVPGARDVRWFPWPMSRPFVYDGEHSLVLEVNVPDPHGSDPSATFQLFRNHASAVLPRRRVLGPPGQPLAGCGERTVYAMQFHLVKRKHQAQTRWLDISRGGPPPVFRLPAIAPAAAALPEGTESALWFQGADHPSGTGETPWSRDLTVANGKRFLRLRARFTSNPTTGTRPWLDSVALIWSGGP